MSIGAWNFDSQNEVREEGLVGSNLYRSSVRLPRFRGTVARTV